MKKMSTFIFSVLLFLEYTLFSSAYSYTSDITTVQDYSKIHGIIIAVGLGLTIIISIIIKITKLDDYIPVFVLIGLTTAALLITSIKEFISLTDTVSTLSMITMSLFFIVCLLFLIMYIGEQINKFNFEITSTKILSTLLVTFVLSTSVLGLLLHQSKIDTAKSEAKNYNYMMETTEIKNKLDEANDYISDLQKKLDDNEKTLDFYDSFIVFCDDDSNYYHKYECDEWNQDAFYAYNIDTAKKQGYKPCPDCIK